VDDTFEKQMLSEQNCDGDFLKKYREYKKIPLERMSEITKISAYYISSVEKMDAKNLPAPVFVRGYVSQVCKVLGLDENKVCSSYMKSFKEKIGK
jgi:flagellar biosynthesis protein FlhG